MVRSAASRGVPLALALLLSVGGACRAAHADSLEGGEPSDRTRVHAQVDHGVLRALVVPAWNDVLQGASVRAHFLQGALAAGARREAEDGTTWAFERSDQDRTLVVGDRRIPLLPSRSLLPAAQLLEAQPLATTAAALEASPGSGRAIAASAWIAPGSGAWLRARVVAAADSVSLQALPGIRGWYRVVAHGTAASPVEYDVRVELDGAADLSLVFLVDGRGITCVSVNGVGVAMYRVRTLLGSGGGTWPEANGPDFVIAMARRQLGKVTRPTQLAILQAVAGRPVVLDEAVVKRWNEAAEGDEPDEVLRGLVTLAGRRNAEAPYKLTQSVIEEGAIVLADLSLPGLVVPQFADGGRQVMTPEEVGVPPGDPVVAGEASASPKLKALATTAR